MALELIRKYRDHQALDVWISRLLDPDVSTDAIFALMILTDEEPTGFAAAYEEAESAFSHFQETKN